MINYAHRGASEQAPENTFAAFYLALEMGANGIETDLHATQDGRLVLFHDDTLARILPGVPGGVPDYTYEALLRFDFGAHKGERYRGERIVLLEDFLLYFGAKDLSFAIEIKQPGTEEAALEAIERFGLVEKTVMTSFAYDSILRIRALHPRMRTGYLTRETGDALFARMRADGVHQYCPNAASVTPQLVGQAKALGFSVRAWGVQTRALMEACCACGVDGMTVNFPDALSAYVSKARGAGHVSRV